MVQRTNKFRTQEGEVMNTQMEQKMKFMQQNNKRDCEGSFSNGRRMVKLMWSQTVVWQTRQRCVQVCRRWRGWRKWAREGGRGGMGGGKGSHHPSHITVCPLCSQNISFIKHWIFEEEKGRFCAKELARYRKRGKIFAKLNLSPQKHYIWL